MKKEWILAGALSLVVGAPTAFAHPEDGESRVSIELDQSSSAAGDVQLSFELIDLKERKTLGDADLAVTHTKKLHLFVFDPALKEFRHEHPEFADGSWKVTVNLPTSGNYWVWAQGETASDHEEFATSVRLDVTGGLPANPETPVLGELRAGTDGTAKVTLSPGRIRAKNTVMLNLDFTRTDGTAPQLTPYLGELAHVIGVPSDGDSLLHVHPMNHGVPNQLMLHAVFPEAGDYRLWVQFIDGGVLRTVPLSVTVYQQ